MRWDCWEGLRSHHRLVYKHTKIYKEMARERLGWKIRKIHGEHTCMLVPMNAVQVSLRPFTLWLYRWMNNTTDIEVVMKFQILIQRRLCIALTWLGKPLCFFSCIWTGWLPASSLWRCSGHVQPEREPRANQEHAEVITYLIWKRLDISKEKLEDRHLGYWA